MAAHQHPDFDAMAERMNTISNQHASLAVEPGMMKNLPALDAKARILAAIADLSRHMDERFNKNNLRLDEINPRFDSM